jgi:hypothetical protein
MTRERYFKMCEQLGQEPKEDEIPPDWEDFPEIVVDAMRTFQTLGNFVLPDVGFLGKDFTTLPYYIEMYGIKDTELFLEILTMLESRAIKQSQEELKRERDKLKRKK